MKKIVFFSGSRAEYNIQYPILKKFQKNKLFKVYFIIAGSHTSTTVGNTLNEIKKDNIESLANRKFQHKNFVGAKTTWEFNGDGSQVSVKAGMFGINTVNATPCC